MKQMKYILLLLAALLSSASAWAQGISFYGEWSREHSGKLDAKVWHTEKFARSESVEDKDGKLTIFIFNIDSMKAYVLNPEKKTCLVMDLKDLSLNKIVGLDVEDSRRHTREFIRTEDVDGRPCKLYHIVTFSKMKGREEEADGSYYDWIYEPMIAKNYNGCIKTDNTIYTMDRCIVLRKIQIGPQPASLFEVPKDYTRTEVPLGGMMEMVTGKSREENQKDADKAGKDIKENFEQIQKAGDQNKSQEDQIKDLMKLFESMQKKK